MRPEAHRLIEAACEWFDASEPTDSPEPGRIELMRAVAKWSVRKRSPAWNIWLQVLCLVLWGAIGTYNAAAGHLWGMLVAAISCFLAGVLTCIALDVRR